MRVKLIFGSSPEYTPSYLWFNQAFPQFIPTTNDIFQAGIDYYFNNEDTNAEQILVKAGYTSSQLPEIVGSFNGTSDAEKAIICQWDVSNVTSMKQAFQNKDTFDEDIGHLDVSNVTDMSSMFSDAEHFNEDITGWDVSSSQDMSEMFSGASALRKNVRLWAPEPTSTNFNNMFYGSTEMIENYRGTVGWLTGSTPTIEFFDPSETYVFQIPNGSSFSEEINYLGTGNIGVPDVGSLIQVEILSNAESHYFELIVNTPIQRSASAVGSQKDCLDPHERSRVFTSLGDSVLISDLGGIGLTLRSKSLLYHTTNTNYDIDLLYTFDDDNTTNVHIEVNVNAPASACPCRVFSGTEKEAGFFQER